MNVEQKSILGWISRVIAKDAGRSRKQRQSPSAVQQLDALQLRQVTGGDGGSTQLPKHTW